MALENEDPVISIAKKLTADRELLANQIKKDLIRLKSTIHPDQKNSYVWTQFSPGELFRLTKSLHGKDQGKYNHFVRETVKEIKEIAKKAFKNFGCEMDDESIIKFLEKT